jgi:formylglycine-generating enzyme required for sulfatase activity
MVQGVMPSKVFISYRRDDSRYQARIIYQAFCRVLPREHVFMDIDSIPPGANFHKTLRNWINESEVLLALVGPGWIDATDPKTSLRRLDNPSDFVRIEIGEALARDIPVVPVLLDGTPMPDFNVLPDDLKELVDRQAEFVEYRTFDADVERLIKKLMTQRPAQAVPARPVVAPQAVTAPVVPPPRAASGENRMRAKGRIKVDANFVYGAPEGWFKPGAGKTEWFKEHEHGPELVVVPANSFLMGSTENDGDKPVHKVVIPTPFAVGRFPVTFAEWDACVADGGCKGHRPSDEGWGRDRRPVINVSWDEAKLYVDWLSAKTGKHYRLLSEAEREYVTRAGTTTPFWWGSSITPKQANYNGNHRFDDCEKGEYRKRTVPVDSFEANPWGLFDVHGNVCEWCEDLWHDNYNGAPTDGSAWLQGGDGNRRVGRGGSWYDHPQFLRSSFRIRIPTVNQDIGTGFRVGRTLNP